MTFRAQCLAGDGRAGTALVGHPPGCVAHEDGALGALVRVREGVVDEAVRAWLLEAHVEDRAGSGATLVVCTPESQVVTSPSR